jgi:hypothetical protein
MMTRIRDLDRIILLEYIEKEDYLALLLTNKYIYSLFDDIFFRNKLLKEFNFKCKTNPKRYYNIVYFLNKMNDLFESNKKIGIICINSSDEFWNNKVIIINQVFNTLIYFMDRNEISLYVGVTYNPVLFTTNINQIYIREHENGQKIEYDTYKVLKIRHKMLYHSAYNIFCDTFILTLDNKK